MGTDMPTFTQEEAQQLYMHLYTLTFALKDIETRGLTVHTVPQELAAFYQTLQRVAGEAKEVLDSIEVS